MNELSNKLKSSLLKSLNKDLDKPSLIIGNRSFTNRELIFEVESESEIGIKLLTNILMLSIDLLSRGKEKIE